MKVPMNAFSSTIEALLRSDARRATKFLSEKLTVKAVRRHRASKRHRRVEIVVTFGEPNFEERRLIKLARVVKQPFPIRAVQLKFYPKEK